MTMRASKVLSSDELHATNNTEATTKPQRFTRTFGMATILHDDAQPDENRSSKAQSSAHSCST